MTSRFCDPALIVKRSSPGKLAGTIAFVVGLACVVTFIGVTLGVHLVGRQIDRAVSEIGRLSYGWLSYSLTFVVAFWILLSWLPPARLSRALRVAVLLPGAHALVVALAWPAWLQLSRFVTDRSSASALVTDYPLAQVVGLTLAGFAAFSLVIARRRSGEWLHGFVMLALTELLLLGLWLPISCAAWPGGAGTWWTPEAPLMAHVAPRVAFTIAPPTVLAFAYTALALRRPAQLLAWRRVTLPAIGVLLTVALMTRLVASAREMVLYSNLLPLLLTAMIVAIAALVMFGIALAVRGVLAHRAFARMKRVDGVIVEDGSEPALGFEITSWLRGPRTVQRTFAISTPAGTIPVSGAHLVAVLPAATTQLEVGECIAVLRPRDRVVVAGTGTATGAPFRSSAAPLAGELYVAPADRPAVGFSHVALAMWRPAVAYLLIVVAVAIPALAALAAT